MTVPGMKSLELDEASPARLVVSPRSSQVPRGATARDPARRISFTSCVGYYRSSKMGCEYPFESLPERDAMVLLDVDSSIAAFHAQPETFKWVEAGRRRRYTPDLLIEHRSGCREYREVKPQKLMDLDATLDGRLDRILLESAARGAAFAFWTKEDIQRPPRLPNAKRLRSALAFLDAESVRLVHGAIAVLGLPVPLGTLATHLRGGIQLDATILGLIARGNLAADIALPLGPMTAITRGPVVWNGPFGTGPEA